MNFSNNSLISEVMYKCINEKRIDENVRGGRIRPPYQIGLTNRDISFETRKGIMRCYIWSTLLYGAETWRVTSAMVKRLETFEMLICRRMVKMSWSDKISNKEMLRRANVNRQLTKSIQQRSLQFFGHLVRRRTLKKNIHRVLMEGKINGKKERGRLTTSWENNIVKWTGFNYPDVVRSDQHRMDVVGPSNRSQVDGT